MLPSTTELLRTTILTKIRVKPICAGGRIRTCNQSPHAAQTTDSKKHTPKSLHCDYPAITSKSVYHFTTPAFQLQLFLILILPHFITAAFTGVSRNAFKSTSPPSNSTHIHFTPKGVSTLNIPHSIGISRRISSIVGQ